ncbi:MAG: hypothetical protein HFF52_04485 [Lawsonibacter sp.]|nr:hypothetical protein [Lawsonibacter sp.]
MNFNEEKLTKLGALKRLAQRVNESFATKQSVAELSGRVDKLPAVDLTGYVEKEAGKGLSSNDYTDEEKARLNSLDFAADEEVAAMLDEVFGGETA